MRAMGWRHEEVACEGPLTPEEITEAAHWGHHNLASNHASTATRFLRGNRQAEESGFQENQHEKLNNLLQLKHHLKYSFGDRDGLRSVMQVYTLCSYDQMNIHNICIPRCLLSFEISVQQKHEREITTLSSRGVQFEQTLRMGSDLKKALLATMGVLADSDLEDENEDSDVDC